MKIGYIVINKKGKFRTFIGTPIESPGDNDSFMDVLASGSKFDNLKDAQQFLVNNNEGIDKICLKPVEADPIMGTWLNEFDFSVNI